MTKWHHAPPHRLKPIGKYMITAATLHKEHFFANPKHLDQLQHTLFSLIKRYQIELKAWALFSNHYHLILEVHPESEELSSFIRHFHSLSARELNHSTSQPGRRIWYQFWDTLLTYQDSYHARLRYVMQNPVHHDLVTDAKEYQWCSAQWFTKNAEPGHCKTIMSYKCNRINVNDGFEKPILTVFLCRFYENNLIWFEPLTRQRQEQYDSVLLLQSP